MTLQPGWRWSECIKPVAGTDGCQIRHVGLVEAGAMHIVHDDGTEGDVRPGHVIEPGHDAWVVGDEPLVAYESRPPLPRSTRAPATPDGRDVVRC